MLDSVRWENGGCWELWIAGFMATVAPAAGMLAVRDVLSSSGHRTSALLAAPLAIFRRVTPWRSWKTRARAMPMAWGIRDPR
jgi:hypothetical protein